MLSSCDKVSGSNIFNGFSGLWVLCTHSHLNGFDSVAGVDWEWATTERQLRRQQQQQHGGLTQYRHTHTHTATVLHV